MTRCDAMQAHPYMRNKGYDEWCFCRGVGGFSATSSEYSFLAMRKEGFAGFVLIIVGGYVGICSYHTKENNGGVG